MKYGWSLCVRRWNELAEILGRLRLTWEKEFVVRSAVANIPRESGVYMLCTTPPRCPSFGDGAGLFNALYVGRAENLQRRFKDYQRRKNISKDAIHALDELPGKGEKISFIFSVVPLEQLGEMEGRLIACLGPAVNKRDEFKLRGKVGKPLRV